MITFEGPGVSFAWPGFVFSLTWRGLIIWQNHRSRVRWLWLPKEVK